MEAKKRAFVPSAIGRLEDRVVLSQGLHSAAVAGPAILTTQEFALASNRVQYAFENFAEHSQDIQLLLRHLHNAERLIPFYHQGLEQEVTNEVSNLASNINSGTAGALFMARKNVLNDFLSFVQQEVASGTVVIR
jgi:hypothetical protein